MKNIYMRMAVVVFSIAIGACASGPMPTIDITPDTLTNIKTISVITPPDFETYGILNFGHGATMVPFIGGAIAASDMEKKGLRLTEAMKEQEFSLSTTLAKAIKNKLSNIGYQVAIEKGPWKQEKKMYTMQFEEIQSDADVVLVVIPTIVGFVVSIDTDEYLPTIWASARLLDKSRKNQVYSGFHATGWEPKGEGWRYTPSSSSFSDFNDIMANPPVTSESLRSAANSIATTIADDFLR